MTKPLRRILTTGNYCIVEHGLLADLTSPSATAWEEMLAGRWTEDPNLESIPDDAQISQTQKLRTGIQWFAKHGVPQPSYCTVNSLRDGVWEFKLGRVRISFYDTDGDGNFEPKHRIVDIQDAEEPNSEYWWLPWFDPNIRLGHCFGKQTEKTEEVDIAETLRVRKEDLEHDRT